MTDRSALVIPGRGYPVEGPLLMYAAAAVQRRGVAPMSIHWQAPADITTVSSAERESWVCAQVDPYLTDGALLIGKSLGTYAARIAADRALPAIWLTPLLADERIRSALQAATRVCLLVGGTADATWDADAARRLSPHVSEVDGGDHGLMVDGPLARCAEALGSVSTAIERFLDTVVWP